MRSNYKEEADLSAVPKGTAAGVDSTGRQVPTLTFGPSAQQLSMTSSTGGSPMDEVPHKLDMTEMLKEVLLRQTDILPKHSTEVTSGKVSLK